RRLDQVQDRAGLARPQHATRTNAGSQRAGDRAAGERRADHRCSAVPRIPGMAREPPEAPRYAPVAVTASRDSLRRRLGGLTRDLAGPPLRRPATAGVKAQVRLGRGGIPGKSAPDRACSPAIARRIQVAIETPAMSLTFSRSASPI